MVGNACTTAVSWLTSGAVVVQGPGNILERENTDTTYSRR